MTNVTASIGKTNYTVAIQAGAHTLAADEPLARGGQDAGPAPRELLLAALASCTAITLRMYAERKQWALDSVHVDTRLRIEADKKVAIDRVLTLSGDLNDEQRARLADIAERTPVTLTLKSGVEIHTSLAA